MSTERGLRDRYHSAFYVVVVVVVVVVVFPPLSIYFPHHYHHNFFSLCFVFLQQAQIGLHVAVGQCSA